MTLNLAHRGARTLAPENTLPAFELAMSQGADGIELDVQLSADGRLFALHDLTLDRTTSGRGRAVDLRLDELQALDAGANRGEEWRGTRIPSLDEIVETLPAHTYLNIELKLYSPRSDGLEEAVRAFVVERGIEERVIVSSFNPLALWRLRESELALGLLYSPSMAPWVRYGQTRRFLRLDALHPKHTIVRAPLPDLPVNTWTVNEPAEMQRLLALGVNAIITDVPDQLAAIIRAAS